MLDHFQDMMLEKFKEPYVVDWCRDKELWKVSFGREPPILIIGTQETGGRGAGDTATKTEELKRVFADHVPLDTIKGHVAICDVTDDYLGEPPVKPPVNIDDNDYKFNAGFGDNPPGDENRKPPEVLMAKICDNVNWILGKLREGKHVLVHCNAGVSRSPTVVAKLIMDHNEVSFEDAEEIIKENLPATIEDLRSAGIGERPDMINFKGLLEGSGLCSQYSDVGVRDEDELQVGYRIKITDGEPQGWSGRIGRIDSFDEDFDGWIYVKLDGVDGIQLIEIKYIEKLLTDEAADLDYSPDIDWERYISESGQPQPEPQPQPQPHVVRDDLSHNQSLRQDTPPMTKNILFSDLDHTLYLDVYHHKVEFEDFKNSGIRLNINGNNIDGYTVLPKQVRQGEYYETNIRENTYYIPNEFIKLLNDIHLSENVDLYIISAGGKLHLWRAILDVAKIPEDSKLRPITRKILPEPDELSREPFIKFNLREDYDKKNTIKEIIRQNGSMGRYYFIDDTPKEIREVGELKREGCNIITQQIPQIEYNEGAPLKFNEKKYSFDLQALMGEGSQELETFFHYQGQQDPSVLVNYLKGLFKQEKYRKFAEERKEDLFIRGDSYTVVSDEIIEDIRRQLQIPRQLQPVYQPPAPVYQRPAPVYQQLTPFLPPQQQNATKAVFFDLDETLVCIGTSLHGHDKPLKSPYIFIEGHSGDDIITSDYIIDLLYECTNSVDTDWYIISSGNNIDKLQLLIGEGAKSSKNINPNRTVFALEGPIDKANAIDAIMKEKNYQSGIFVDDKIKNCEAVAKVTNIIKCIHVKKDWHKIILPGSDATEEHPDSQGIIYRPGNSDIYKVALYSTDGPFILSIKLISQGIKDEIMEYVGGVGRPVEQGPVEQGPVEQGPPAYNTIFPQPHRLAAAQQQLQGSEEAQTLKRRIKQKELTLEWMRSEGYNTDAIVAEIEEAKQSLQRLEAPQRLAAAPLQLTAAPLQLTAAPLRRAAARRSSVEAFWQYQSDDGDWIYYDPKISTEIEKKYSLFIKDNTKRHVDVDDDHYIDLKNMHEGPWGGTKKRAIRRLAPGVGGYKKNSRRRTKNKRKSKNSKRKSKNSKRKLKNSKRRKTKRSKRKRTKRKK